jgi:hypothetical protein
MKLIINCVDNLKFYCEIEDLLKMEDFYIKNLITDTTDFEKDNQTDIEIDYNENFDIIKNIFDSLRYKNLIFNKETNLKLMYQVCDKWCVSEWLIKSIENEINGNKKLNNIVDFINNLNGNTVQCDICNNGFNINNNTKTSCKRHTSNHIIAGTSIYYCCGKEDPCQIGYHVYKPTITTSLIDTIKDLI